MRPTLVLSIVGLSLASGCMAKAPDANTREHMIAGMTAVLKSWDRDGDRRLSRTEVTAMVNEFFRRVAQDASGGKMTADLEKQRQDFLGFYASQDADGDGYLTLDELLRGPLASFACMDENHDGKLTKDETFNGMDRCPSVNLDAYAQKP